MLLKKLSEEMRKLAFNALVLRRIEFARKVNLQTDAVLVLKIAGDRPANLLVLR